jgi:antitoxin component of MazEF toxin-antitoxin module
MKVIRRLSRRGNSFHVSIPPQFVNHLRLSIADPILVRVTERGTIEMSLAHEADFRGAQVPPMNLELPAAVSK